MALLFTLGSCTKAVQAEQGKRVYMWVDCEANFARMSSADSIALYTEKMKSIGVTDIVVDVKSIMGETLYASKYAPYMGEFEGTVRPLEYDMMRHFIDEGHKHGMRVHGFKIRAVEYSVWLGSPGAARVWTGISENSTSGSRSCWGGISTCCSASIPAKTCTPRMTCV